jgi:hypothetical protein
VHGRDDLAVVLDLHLVGERQQLVLDRGELLPGHILEHERVMQ